MAADKGALLVRTDAGGEFGEEKFLCAFVQ